MFDSEGTSCGMHLFYFSVCHLFSGAAHNIIINKKNAFSWGNFLLLTVPLNYANY